MAGKGKKRDGKGSTSSGGKKFHNNTTDFKSLVEDSDSEDALDDPLVKLLSEDVSGIDSAQSKLLLAAALSNKSRSGSHGDTHTVKMTGAQLSTVKAALRSKKTAKKAKEKAAETAALTTSILATLTSAGYVVKPEEQKSGDQKPALKKKTKTPASPKPTGDTDTEDGDEDEDEAAPTPEKKKKKKSKLDKVKAKLDSTNETVAKLRAVLAEVVDSSPIAGSNR